MTFADVLSIEEEHADTAAFLWSRREAATFAPQHDLGTLADLDRRIESHLDGIRVRGAVAQRYVDSLPAADPGSIFVACVRACEREDDATLAGLLGKMSTPAHESAFLFGLTWVSDAQALEVIGPMLASRTPALRRLGFLGCAARRHDPGSPLGFGLADQDTSVAVAAARSAAVLGRADLGEAVEALLGRPFVNRLEIGAALALLGRTTTAATILWELVTAPDALRRAPATPATWTLPTPREAATMLAVLCVEPREAAARLESLMDHELTARAALAGAASLGDAGALRWLVERCEDPRLARKAGEAFSLISGIALLGELASPRPERAAGATTDDPADERVALDGDDLLPWPNVAAVSRALGEKKAVLRAGTQYILGAPRAAAGALDFALQYGSQRVRWLAAFALAMADPSARLAPVGAPIRGIGRP